MAETEFVEIFTAQEDQPEMAKRLLEAAEPTPEVVATVFGGFRVPVEVAQKAGVIDVDAVDDNAPDRVLDQRAAEDADPDGEGEGSGTEQQPLLGVPTAEGDPAPEAATGGPAAAEGAPVPPEAPGAPVAAQGVEDGDDDGELRGEALDEALRSAGLPLTGKVADKRARLAAHQAAASN